MCSLKIRDNVLLSPVSIECELIARLNQSRKYMLKVAAEMQSNLKNKAPE